MLKLNPGEVGLAIDNHAAFVSETWMPGAAVELDKMLQMQ